MTPGVEERESVANYLRYTVRLGFAIVLTMTSSIVSQTIAMGAGRTDQAGCPCFCTDRGLPRGLFANGQGTQSHEHILAPAFGVLIVRHQPLMLDHGKPQCQYRADEDVPR